jgi:hypothetical protein
VSARLAPEALLQHRAAPVYDSDGVASDAEVVALMHSVDKAVVDAKQGAEEQGAVADEDKMDHVCMLLVEAAECLQAPEEMFAL